MISASVVVPVRNGAITVADTLTALTHQAHCPEVLEIIVVDNGSTDRTREIVRPFDVTLLEETKPGPAAARNRGLYHARGDLVVHLDADTLPARTWLREIIAPFADPNTLLVGGKTLAFRPETAAERYVARAGLYDTEAHIARRPFPFVASLNMAMRRRPAIDVGGWAEEMRTAEDVDLCHRLLRQCPSPLVYQASAVLFHRNRTTDAGLRRQAWTYGEGVAQMYFRYPDVLGYDAWQAMRISARIIGRGAQPLLLRIGHWMGSTTAEDVEFARYHRLWTWWFWRGFFSYRRHRAYRSEGWQAA